MSSLPVGWPHGPPSPAMQVKNAGQPIHGAVGGPTHGNTKKPSDQRFRSFAERYMIARAHYFSQDPHQLAEDTWECILDAKRAYRMIQRTGENIEPEDGVF